MPFRSLCSKVFKLEEVSQRGLRVLWAIPHPCWAPQCFGKQSGKIRASRLVACSWEAPEPIQIANDYQPCCDVDARLKRQRGFSAAPTPGYQLQPTARTALSASSSWALRVSKVDQDPVAHGTSQMKPSKRLHRRCDTF